MSNLAGILKEAMRRLARKEIRAETGKTRQAVAQYRRDIAWLKRELVSQRRQIGFLKAQEQKRLGLEPAAEEPEENVRYSARSVRAQRRRLKLSAADYGKLVGVSGLTVYSWEHGKSRPRKAQLARLVAVRGVGKREAVARLDVLNAARRRAAAKIRRRGRKKPR
jgi:DNA-binding transcriptional regulator YiaG